jgi:20S proteasome subunit beta 6
MLFPSRGTIAGIAGKDFCIIAADTRLSESYLVRSRDVIRLFQVEESSDCSLVFGGCGCWSDTLALAKIIQHNARVFRWKHNYGLNSCSGAHLLLQLLYTRRMFPYYSFCVLASVDQQGNNIIVHHI